MRENMKKSDIEELARGYLEQASLTMQLEGQELTEEENKKMFEKWVHILTGSEVFPKGYDQAQVITCAVCGITLDFKKYEVFSSGPSYVCKEHIGE
jgi:hypothetical protein